MEIEKDKLVVSTENLKIDGDKKDTGNGNNSKK